MISSAPSRVLYVVRAYAVTLIGIWALAIVAAPNSAEARPLEPSQRSLSSTPVLHSPVLNSDEPATTRLIIRLDQLERQVTELTGRIELLEAELANQKAIQAQKQLDEETKRAHQDLADHPQASSTSDPAEQDKTTIAPQTAPEMEETADFLFKAAQQELTRGDYGNAETKLTSLLLRFPEDPQAVEARWLLGEVLFVQSAWGPAVEAYLAYLKAAPQGQRASEAFIRLAGAFGQLGNEKMRCQALAQYQRQTTKPDATLKARADAEIARKPCPAT
ncbi:tetratricopeptide repeat protein [Candidatus Phycosocius spiralis]|uniref:Cell division coordinator CpoB n=1 Tax=Candidatus Phycosocius spiralis TaxID=2815099 RepID=A0ABQ4PVJ2_9PROT|nr:tetratricopeptide repeat protein [Candidatus Phycosocius spiralis]GIU67000.1 hypothetical protein PsB1_1154 [Candidatus Phycosocius spiralis]